jgi:hypothetical protein
LPARAEWETKPLEEICSIAQFSNQQEVIDVLLGKRCLNYVDYIQQNLSLNYHYTLWKAMKSIYFTYSSLQHLIHCWNIPMNR